MTDKPKKKYRVSYMFTAVVEAENQPKALYDAAWEIGYQFKSVGGLAISVVGEVFDDPGQDKPVEEIAAPAPEQPEIAIADNGMPF